MSVDGVSAYAEIFPVPANFKRMLLTSESGDTRTSPAVLCG